MITVSELANFEANLEASPIYNLSLSSKELFHSNFLGWLTETYKNEMTSVWSDFLLGDFSWGKIVNVYREQKSRDLTFEYENGNRFIVEVKVKSAPDVLQLQRYFEELLSEQKKRPTDHVDSRKSNSTTNGKDFQLGLLSFLNVEGGTNVESFEVDWQGKSYLCPWIPWNELASKIKNTFQDLSDHYHKELILDYCYYISQFGRIAPGIEIDWNNDHNFFLDDNIRDEQIRMKLQGLRLHDFVFKARYASLAHRLAKSMSKHGARVAPWDQGKTGEILTNSGMTNATGVTGIGYILSGVEIPPNKPIIIGIQLQHRSYRFFFESFRNSPSEIKACVEKLYEKKLWFQLDDLKEYCSKQSMRNKFCQYSGQFYYTYQNIDQTIAPEKLLELISKHIQDIMDRKSEILKVVSDELKL